MAQNPHSHRIERAVGNGPGQHGLTHFLDRSSRPRSQGPRRHQPRFVVFRLLQPVRPSNPMSSPRERWRASSDDAKRALGAGRRPLTVSAEPKLRLSTAASPRAAARAGSRFSRLQPCARLDRGRGGPRDPQQRATRLGRSYEPAAAESRLRRPPRRGASRRARAFANLAAALCHPHDSSRSSLEPRRREGRRDRGGARVASGSLRCARQSRAMRGRTTTRGAPRAPVSCRCSPPGARLRRHGT
jgi:hypothetical protein